MSVRPRPNDQVVELAAHQTAAMRSETRFDVRVWHRRAGKTYYTVLRKLMRLAEQPRDDWQAFYIAPTRVQAKQIAWPYLAQFASAMGARLSVSDLKLIVPNKGFIQLVGGEQYDRLRGLYADDVTFDEAALIPSPAWSEVVSPMISDRKGRATFMGTPAGRMNLLWQLFDQAGGEDPDWSRSLLKVTETGMLSADEIERNRRSMSEAQFNQEFLCSWTAALPGAFYAREIEALTNESRLTSVKYERSLPVVAALDLGHRDLMPVGWFQRAGTEVRCIGVRCYQFTSIPDMVASWKDLPWPTERLIVPHDAHVKELGSGRTREETFWQLGVDTYRLRNMPLDEGIEAVRRMLPHLWVDRQEAAIVVEALGAYRSHVDEVRGVSSVSPLHDWSSHYADMVRYAALGLEDALPTFQTGERPSLRTGVRV